MTTNLPHEMASGQEAALHATPRRVDLARAARWYADHGWCVFPLIPGSKRPAVTDWEHQATTDLGVITATWQHDAFNIGIACGPSDLLVVDLDTPKPDQQPPTPWREMLGITDGADVLAALAEHAAQPYPHHTHTVATPSGGTHLYFTPPAGVRLTNTAGRLGWLVDTRGHGGYVVAAGSVTDAGLYRTLNPLRPAPLPGWITSLLLADHAGTGSGCRVAPRPGESPLAVAYAHAALRAELDQLLHAPMGTRNSTLNAAAFALGQLVGAGFLEEPLVAKALGLAAVHIGLAETEADATIGSGLAAGARHPRRTG